MPGCCGAGLAAAGVVANPVNEVARFPNVPWVLVGGFSYPPQGVRWAEYGAWVLEEGMGGRADSSCPLLRIGKSARVVGI